jgi:hypothetical protein
MSEEVRTSTGNAVEVGNSPPLIVADGAIDDVSVIIVLYRIYFMQID